MNLEDLQVLYNYHYWARDRTLEAVEPLGPEPFTRAMGNSFTSIRDTLVHIYAAEWIWHERWNGHSPTSLIASDGFPDLVSIRRAWADLESNIRGFLQGLGEDGLRRSFSYHLLNGQPGTSLFWHSLQHVVNHASYHRGQITTMLRQLGAAPPKSCDLITFYRERTAHT
jgi:uncharacterized damage-inducible protein DinB